MPRSLSTRQKVRLACQMAAVDSIIPDREQRFTVLDVGTEYGYTGGSIHAHWRRSVVTGIEIHGPTIDECLSENGEHYDELVQTDALRWMAERTREWDVVVAAEIVEHVSKAEGVELLAHVARVTRKLAIVTTPLGFMAQGALFDNPYQRHVSGWERKELEALGWTTLAVFPGLSLGVYYMDKTGTLP